MEKRTVRKAKSGKQSQVKTLSSKFSDNFPAESQETIDRFLEQGEQAYKKVSKYVQENPKEAAGLAVALGMAAWALLGTKPGRKVFDSSAATIAPKAAKWFKDSTSENLQ